MIKSCSMKYLYDFFINNFVLLCIVAVLSVTLIRKLKKQRRISIYLLIILFITLLLPIFDTLQEFSEVETKSVFGATFCAACMYVLRPACLLCFIFLSGQKFKGVWFYILLAVFTLNVVINIFPFFEGTKELSYFYWYSEVEGIVKWQPGYVQLFRFMPHIVSFFYLAFLLYQSIGLLQRKHFADAIGISVCAAVIFLAAIIETFFNEDGVIEVLPTSIAACTVFYYLFLYERTNKIDVLTGLFNRASYFDDFSKASKNVTGIIQLDMNGLKYLNDNYGHLEGDKGLKRIAEAINNNITRKMYAYRLGGDEFIVFAVNESEEKVLKFISSFKEELKKTKYYCSIGYAYRNKETDTTDNMFKLSEERMYSDKAEFYKTAQIKRRKSAYIGDGSNEN